MIKLLSLFSGIGAFEAALRRGGYQFETVNYCEIDPYASKAYSQIHGISEDFNLHDVRTVNPLLMNNVNLVTYGFPCVDISVAGKQEGFFKKDGSVTRSGLFFEALRIIEFLQPEYAICENVKALTSKKFEKEFNTVLNSLAEVGYNNYWKVLNAKDYGVPQNRERIFIISIRKDIDTGAFTFPEKQELKLRVKDMLEPVVDEKYYIDNERSRNLIRQITAKFDLGGDIAVSDGTIKEPDLKDIANCITARYDAGVQNQKSIGTMVLEPVICRSVGRDPDNPSNREKGCNTEQTLELKKDGCSNTLTTVQKDNLVVEPLKIMQPVVIGSTQEHAAVKNDGVCPCLTTAMGTGGGQIPMITIKRLGNLYDENAGGARGTKRRGAQPHHRSIAPCRHCFRGEGHRAAEFAQAVAHCSQAHVRKIRLGEGQAE